ncbi:MAG: hypothetical protein J6Z12_01885 [Paludibacteraceae bacterium]|nr:hypothetical protein [Paludibacteraceae bacterium]
MENNSNMQNDDLTIREILDQLSVLWTKWIWSPLLFMIRFIARKWLPLTAFAAAGFLCMFVWCKSFPIYKGVVMFQNNVWRSSDFILNLRQLNLEDPSVVAGKLNMDFEVVKDKRSIIPHFVYSTDSLYMACFVDYWDQYFKPHEDKMYIMTSRFAVEVRATSLQSLDGWVDGLLYYFNNDPYINVLGVQRVQSIEHRAGFVADELAKLDSLQSLEYFARERRNVVVSGLPLVNPNPELYHDHVLGLSERLDDYKSALQYDADPVVVVTDMQKEAAPLNYWGNFTVKSLITGFVIGLVLMLLLTYRSAIGSFLKGGSDK